MPNVSTAPVPNERSLLIVEDDKSFLQRLARAMEGRGFTVSTAESVADGLLQVEKAPPAFAEGLYDPKTTGMSQGAKLEIVKP